MATITGQAKLHGLQHAEQQTILKGLAVQFASYAKATITITGFTAAAGVVTVMFTASGIKSIKGGSDIFTVPVPEVGSGISFAIVAAIFGAFAYFRAKRSPAI